VRLGRLTAENFRSFATIDIDLNARGLIAVVGDNGAGKSSIFTAVEWALYGPQPGRNHTPARRDGTPDGETCWVELEFECAERRYTVYRDDAGSARLVDVETRAVRADTVRGVNQAVAVILGLNRDMFCGTFYARQNEIQALDSPKEAERREQLEQLLGIDRLRRAEGHAIAAAKEHKAIVAGMAAGMPDVDRLAQEVTRLETAAREGDPATAEAKARLAALTAHRQAARTRLGELHARVQVAHERLLEAEQARALADREQVIRDNFAERAQAAQTASAQLAELSPIAARAEELTARERELTLLRANHERAVTWRARLEGAMARAAELSEQLAALGPADQGHDAEQLAEALAATENEIETLRADHARHAAAAQAAQARVERLSTSQAAAVRASDLDRQLHELAGAADRVERLSADWQKTNDRKVELAAQVRHDTEHRDAILTEGEHAACPRCKRKYGTEFGDIRAAFDRDIDTATAELAQIGTALTKLVEQGRVARTDAERAQQLAGERRGLGEIASPDEIAAGLATAREELAAAQHQADDVHQRITQLSTDLPGRRQAATAAGQTGLRRRSLTDALAAAQRDVETYTGELQAVTADGYDAAAHDAVRAELAEATQASQRCAALRDAAGSLAVATGRLAEQEDKLGEARAVQQRLSETAVAAAVDPDAVPSAQAECERLDDEVDRAGVALREAAVRATTENAAAEDGRRRLADAKKTARALAAARREERVRVAVAKALGEYRAEAARRARPTLIAETSRLLGTVTDGRYGAIKIGDDYRIEIVDDGVAHPLRRFSGGEQDLAGLCVRLGLSQMAAAQRGVEASFSILDEVFGSQDPTRRRAIAQQLHGLLRERFEQVFVITHTDDVQGFCDLTITVERDSDGVSRVAGSEGQVTRTDELLPAVGEPA
jgi:DNA repair protein SbcC/Rad50